MNDIIISVTLIFLSSALLGLALISWRIGKRLGKVPTIIIDVIFFFILVKIMLYYYLPTIIRIVNNYQFVRNDNVALSDLVILYTIELISWALWIVAFLLTIKIFSNKKLNLNLNLNLNNFFWLNNNESKQILVFITSGFIIIRLFGIFNIDNNFILTLYQSLFYYAGLTAGPFLLIISLRYFNKKIFILGIITSIIAIMSLQTRGAQVYSIIFIIFLVWFVLQNYKAKIVTISLVLVSVISFFIFGGMASSQLYLNESGNISVISGVSSKGKTSKRSTFEEIGWRFGASTRMGTAFINLYERGASAGINPIKHSLMGFLPSTINPNKPNPSTLVADDIYTQGMYIIYREIHGYDTYSMVEFPTGGHFYWEFGMMGVVVLSIISGIYIGLCALYFSSLGPVAIPLMIAVFKPWGYVDPKIWVSDIIMQFYQIILPLVLLVFILRFKKLLFTSVKSIIRHSSMVRRDIGKV